MPGGPSWLAAGHARARYLHPQSALVGDSADQSCSCMFEASKPSDPIEPSARAASSSVLYAPTLSKALDLIARPPYQSNPSESADPTASSNVPKPESASKLHELFLDWFLQHERTQHHYIGSNRTTEWPFPACWMRLTFNNHSKIRFGSVCLALQYDKYFELEDANGII